MTRRRTLLLVLGSLVAVFLAASAVTLYLVRNRLVADLDADLRGSVGALATAMGDLGLDLEGDFGPDANRQAVIVIDGRSEELYIPAGTRSDPVPRPDLSASTIVARVGTPFEVGAVDGDVHYRVLSAPLPDGRFVAVARPLDSLRGTLTTLAISLWITLLAVIATLGLIFWLLLRASLRPYNDMIATAGAIADGDWDRRATTSARVPALDRLATAVNSMLDQVQRSFTAKQEAETRLRRFVSDASHELRTPLTSISGYSELYLSGVATDDDAVTKQMTRINGEAERLGRLVDDLIRLARLDERRPLRSDPVDLVVVARDVVADHRAAHPDSVVEVHGASSAMVEGDHDALRQVVTNLVANARQHGGPGARIDISIDADTTAARIAVGDDGPGMDAETAAHIFDRFYRADRARSGAGGNSGLGLSIVAAIVAAHHGTIAVDTAPGRGTRFVVDLPASSSDVTSR